ncbi:RES family NAD+ phosphorylase [Aquimarina sp. ERC-38]|uniref:RES family NAD+ phosphorylase n=1 Tax=Aquimarina sp. ERC-38 TaxID=2949996 RepID=UPI002248148F|nr:RES family NAD+ phosphorylase [Aquimarina sp. ERC-38]UZO79640.1 RES family NAD+ phosphorylase [Aquimarina sp. ERC-38]
MDLYRITRDKYANSLDASGRANRWNFEKQYVIYASSSRSLATLELVAHRSAIMEGVLYKMIVISVPDNPTNIQTVPLKKLPLQWNLLQNRFITQKIGSEWYLNKKSPICKVPSAIIKEEYNYMINTMHLAFSEIKIKSIDNFEWDQRLL